MAKSALFLSLFAHLGLAAAAAASSSSTASTPASASYATLTMPYGPIGTDDSDLHVYASVIEIKPPLTTIAACIAPVEEACKTELQQTFTYGSDTIGYDTMDSYNGITTSIQVGCTVKPQTAICSASYFVAIAGTSTSSAFTSTITGSEVAPAPVVVTSGAEKLAKETGKPQETGKPNGAPKSTGMSNLALVGGAAVVGVMLAL
ncbi:hypothetical protein MferCBS31731_002482 [Microsporum ferrugineum]